MKLKMTILLVMMIAIVLSACNSSATPTSVQNQPVENTPQSTSTIQHPSWAVILITTLVHTIVKKPYI